MYVCKNLYSHLSIASSVSFIFAEVSTMLYKTLTQCTQCRYIYPSVCTCTSTGNLVIGRN